MASTTRPDFHTDTEALEVAAEFAAQLKGKTVLVTGVNKEGIGFTTAQALASQAPAHVILAGRSQSKLDDCVSAFKSQFPEPVYHTLLVDLSTQQSVRDAAAQLLGWSDVPVVDIIINSAGVMGITERTITKDGVEMHFATNHIGHWLLTCLLMPKLIKASKKSPKGATRIINVSSLSPTTSSMRWSDINFEKVNKDLPVAEQPAYEGFKRWGYSGVEDMAYVPLDGYHRSKTANVLNGIGANKRWFEKYGILSVAVHPGIIWTELGRNFAEETTKAIKEMADKGFAKFKSQGAGASTSCVAALDPKLAAGVGESKGKSENWGSYMIDCQISDQATPLAVSSSEAEKLWELSESLVGQKFEY